MIQRNAACQVLSGLLFFFSGLAAIDARAHEGAEFKAMLIWGTDEAKPNDPDLKPVDPELVEKLQKVFKWKHYFLVKTEPFHLPEKGSKRVELSSKCNIVVRDTGKKPMLEVKLFGEGKLVKTIRHAAPQCLVMAGDCKDNIDTAWFVVLTPK